MTGYLVYDDDKIVGWCNAGDKSHYGPVCADKEFLTDKIEKGTIKVLYFFPGTRCPFSILDNAKAVQMP